MDQVRQLLRYVLPGFVFIAIVGVNLLIVFPDWLVERLKELKDTKDSFGAALASIVAIGALGYVFSSMHHSVHHFRCFRCLIYFLGGCFRRLHCPCCFRCFRTPEVLDHRPVINAIRNNPTLKDKVLKFEKFERDKNDGKLDAEAVSYALFYQQIKKDDEGAIGEAAKTKLESLGDLAPPEKHNALGDEER